MTPQQEGVGDTGVPAGGTIGGGSTGGGGGGTVVTYSAELVTIVAIRGVAHQYARGEVIT